MYVCVCVCARARARVCVCVRACVRGDVGTMVYVKRCWYRGVYVRCHGVCVEVLVSWFLCRGGDMMSV